MVVQPPRQPSQWVLNLQNTCKTTSGRAVDMEGWWCGGPNTTHQTTWNKGNMFEKGEERRFNLKRGQRGSFLEREVQWCVDHIYAYSITYLKLFFSCISNFLCTKLSTTMIFIFYFFYVFSCLWCLIFFRMVLDCNVFLCSRINFHLYKYILHALNLY